MKQITTTRFKYLTAIAALFIASHAYAQSIIIPRVAVVAGDTAVIPLEFAAGGGATNLDFVMDYNPSVVDESSLDFACTPLPNSVGLTTLDCHIDKASNQIRGIGVNLPPLPLNSLISGVFAEISVPIFADAPIGESAVAFAANFASGIATSPFDITWTPKVNESYCNAVLLSGVTIAPTELHEACELLVVDSDFIALDGSSVFLSSGLQIEIMPGAAIDTGAIVNADVCGQSLCQTSPDPMPNGCHSCVVQICDIDPTCCDTEFSQSCVDKVNTVCGLVCQ
ncbi:hypothetical protein ACFL33_02835 [Pseudomonadota bacterium]